MKRFLIKINGKTYDAEVEELQGSVAAAPSVGFASAAPQAAAPVAAPAAAPAAAAGPASVTAPIPGTVLRLVKAVGDAVAAGDVVMIVESMKMENEVVAPEAGKISAIHVAAGAAINTGDVLFSMA